MSFRISFLSSVCQHIFLHPAGNVFHLRANFLAFKLKQNSHFLTRQERDEVGVDGFTSRKEPWEWAQTIDTSLLLIFTSSSASLLLMAHVFNKIPTDPYENFGCHLWLSAPCLCNWSGDQVFLNFHSKSLVPTPAIGDNQKWSPQADLLYVKPARCARLSPNPHREHRENVYFLKFLS